MKTTRREIMMFAGGSAVGVLFTPAPWRLITDTALWSENWPGIPAPARGEIRARYTNCSLCSAGCAVRARCVGDRPVALAGVAGHPLSHGALCPFGLAGHHLPYLPSRVKQGPVKEAAAAVADGIAKCGPAEYVVTLDLRPARTASWTYRRAMAALRNGRYVTPSVDSSIAVDLAKARTVLSLGVPLLDGWGTPGNVMAARPGFRLIQVDPVESRTASMADQWLRIRPGSEDALAQGLAGTMTHAAAAGATGLAESEIAALAAHLEQNGPVLVLGSSRLASTGRTVVTRRETPVPAEWQKAAPVTDLASLPDGSVRVLMVDESAPGEYLPWKAIEKKLVADNPVVVALAWSREGYGRHAQYVVPVGVYPEVAGDIPPAVDSVAATFRLSAPLVPAPAYVVKPEEFVAAAAGLSATGLSSTGLSIMDTLHERADAIHKTGRGTLFTYADAKSVALKDVSAADFWKALNAGGCWLDTAPGTPDDKAPAARFTAAAAELKPAEESELPFVVVLNRELTPASPILSKVYQESNLRLAPNRVALNSLCGLEDGTQVVFETLLGKCRVGVTLDAGIPPGVVQATASPAMLDLCAAGARAKVVRA
jgi:anaerobic selenocysteine-containing dehydrogenase